MVGGVTPVKSQWDRMQPGEPYNTAIEKHVARISQDFPNGIKVKVVVDSGCGAAYFITPHLLRSLGCTVITLNCFPSGIFPHDIEPTRANLGDLMQVVKDSGADLGIAHDGDADRMMAVDDKGRFIPGDKMLAILLGLGSKDIVTTLTPEYQKWVSGSGVPELTRMFQKNSRRGGGSGRPRCLGISTVSLPGRYLAAARVQYCESPAVIEFADSVLLTRCFGVVCSNGVTV
jgi:hypothetical protein